MAKQGKKSKVRFKSERYQTAQNLIEGKDDAWSVVKDRRENLDVVRKFSNGLSVLTLEQAKKMNKREIVNHLITYSKLAMMAATYQSMVTGTKNLFKIKVDTNNAEQDYRVSAQISSILNKGLARRKGKLRHFWDTVSGEIVMAGGVPAMFRDQEGWLPSVEIDMFFPEGSSLLSDDIPCAFNPTQYDLNDIETFLKQIEEGDGEVFIRKNLEYVRDLLKQQTKDRQKGSERLDEYLTSSARDDSESENLMVFDCWEFYEVKFDDKTGNRYVSKTIFTDQKVFGALNIEDKSNNKLAPDDKDENRWIISYEDRAFEDAYEWMAMLYVDTEIGGNKTTDTLRGPAEVMYPSSSEMEELLNAIIEGDKMRSMVRFQPTGDLNMGAIAKWDPYRDNLTPANLEMKQIEGGSSHLQTPLALLEGNVAGITGAPINQASGNDELRVNSVHRQQVSSDVQQVRLGAAYDSLDILAEQIVYRVLSSEIEPGMEGYDDIMWVQSQLTEQGIDFKTFATREYGRFKFLSVSVTRNIATGDSASSEAAVERLMNNLASFNPAARPIILRLATQVWTRDPDLAEDLVEIPETMLNNQRVTAENEFDTIARRAMSGGLISTNKSDVHQDHLQTHMLDLQAMIAEDGIEPWKYKQTLVFSAAVEHVKEHLDILSTNPGTVLEAAPFKEDFQKLIGAATSIFKRVEQERDQQQGGDDPLAGLSAKEQLEMQLKIEKEKRESIKLGIMSEDLRSIRQVREDRARLSNRQQHAREVTEAKRLQLQQKSIDKSANKQDSNDS